MGFGYLFLGYLISFLLMPVADALGVSFVALLLGYVTMLYGLYQLRRFCRSFTYAMWALCPLALLALYRAAADLSTLFLWRLPFVTERVGSIVSYIEFAFVLILHAALLCAVWEIGRQVELKKISASAIGSMVVVAMYATVTVVYFLPIPALKPLRQYLNFSVSLMKPVFVICNLVLFLSCAKNIGIEGEDEAEPKRYRWELLNRLGDSFANTFQRASDRNRSDMENYLKQKKDKQQAREAEEEQRRQAKYRHKKKKK